MPREIEMSETSSYGLWSLVIINSLFFIAFAFSFTRPRTSRDWVSGNRAAFLPTSSAGGDRIEADWPRSVASTALG